jgi:hypothetical protein
VSSAFLSVRFFLECSGQFTDRQQGASYLLLNR